VSWPLGDVADGEIAYGKVGGAGAGGPFHYPPMPLVQTRKRVTLKTAVRWGRVVGRSLKPKSRLETGLGGVGSATEVTD